MPHPLGLGFLVLEHVSLFRVHAVTVFDYKAVEVPLLDVMLLHEQTLHIFYFLRNVAGLPLQYEYCVLVKAQVSILLDSLLFLDLYAIILHPRGVDDELRNVVR